MAFREVDVVEVREVLRGWLEGAGLRTVAARAGVDRKTARRFVAAAPAAGLARQAGVAALTDELIGVVIAASRPARPNGHGAGWELLAARQVEIAGWVAAGRTVVKICELLTRSGTAVPYRTVHRFATAECGFRPKRSTVRVADGEPGSECQIDFAYMGFIVDAATGRRRKVHALIVTAVFSRHMFVHLCFAQRLADVIAGCEAAWQFFGGVFRVVVPDNLSPVVTDALVHPDGGGMRIHGTTAARPLEVFNQLEAGALLPLSKSYDVPLLRSVKVHRDHHVELGRALYSVPSAYLGLQLDARADSQLVKLFHRGQLIKTHPRQPAGGRHTDPADLPAERVGYAMRDLDRLQAAADRHGPNIGIYTQRLLDEPLPWTRMRSVYRLLGLAGRYDPATVDQACATALELDVVSVAKIAAMFEKALEANTPQLPAVAGHSGGRFARDPKEFTTAARRRLAVVPDPPEEPIP